MFDQFDIMVLATRRPVKHVFTFDWARLVVTLPFIVRTPLMKHTLVCKLNDLFVVRFTIFL